MKRMSPRDRAMIPPPEIKKLWKKWGDKYEFRVWGGRHPGVLLVGEVADRKQGPFPWRTIMGICPVGESSTVEEAIKRVEEITKPLWDCP